MGDMVMRMPDGSCLRDLEVVIVKYKPVTVKVGGDAVLHICEPEYPRAEVGVDIQDAERGGGGNGQLDARKITVRHVVYQP